jgi:hypothetical protein
MLWMEMSEAFAIFAKYSDGKYGYVYAEHDRIDAGPDPKVVSPEDKARLEELDWHVDDIDGNMFYRFV